MFDAPKYASYIALCRELRMPRVYWRQGDLRWHPKANQDIWPGQIIVISNWEVADAVWLPRLDQWLTMLEGAGTTGVSFVPNGTGVGYNCVGQRWPQAATTLCSGTTHEEAAARLWMAVTGYSPPSRA